MENKRELTEIALPADIPRSKAFVKQVPYGAKYFRIPSIMLSILCLALLIVGGLVAFSFNNALSESPVQFRNLMILIVMLIPFGVDLVLILLFRSSMTYIRRRKNALRYGTLFSGTVVKPPAKPGNLYVRTSGIITDLSPIAVYVPELKETIVTNLTTVTWKLNMRTVKFPIEIGETVQILFDPKRRAAFLPKEFDIKFV